MYRNYSRLAGTIKVKDWKAFVILLCLIGGVFQFLSAVGSNIKCLTVFKDGNYLPTDAVCTESRSQLRKRRGSRGHHTVYNNTYTYNVDGEEYTVTFRGQSSDMAGKTVVLYYKPGDPEAVATYQSTADWFFEVGFLKYLYAVVLLAIGLIGGYVYSKRYGSLTGEQSGWEERTGGVGTVINDDLDFLDNDDYFQNKY